MILIYILLLIFIFVLMNLIFHFVSWSTILSIMAIPFTRGTVGQRPVQSSAGIQTFYDFSLKELDGSSTIDLSMYKGKKVIILNVASACGYTPQYADWQKFHELRSKDVIVLGIPSNEFGSQEPGSNQEIASFCQKNYGVTFQLFEKIVVKGDNKHPLYKWLSSKDLNGWNDKEPTWNFCKYVINENGELIHFFGSKVLPTDEAFLKALL